MTTETDKEITSYLPLLNENQKEAILTLIKTFLYNSENDSYSEEFDGELQQRFTAFEQGEVPGYTLEETESKARSAYSSKRNK
jgi:hypothetical protein